MSGTDADTSAAGDDEATAGEAVTTASEPPTTDGESPGRAGRPSTGTEDLLARLRVEHRHDRATAALVLAGSLVLAWYGSWLTADLGLGTPTFVVVAAVAAYGLYRQPSRRDVLVVGLYALAALLVATPVFLNLPFLLSAGAYDVANPTAFTMRLADLILLVVFVLLAGVPAVVAWRLSSR